jgi:hypothetical protein
MSAEEDALRESISGGVAFPVRARQVPGFELSAKQVPLPQYPELRDEPCSRLTHESKRPERPKNPA